MVVKKTPNSNKDLKVVNKQQRLFAQSVDCITMIIITTPSSSPPPSPPLQQSLNKPNFSKHQ